MNAEHQLTRVKILEIEALEDKVHLRALVQLSEEFVLIKLENDQRLLRKLIQQVPKDLEVLTAKEHHFSEVLHRQDPSQW